MSARLWVTLLRPTPALVRVTVGVLESHAVSYQVVPVDEIRNRLRQRPPIAALIHGGPVTPVLMDVQRWLAESDVPTAILVEGLTDEVEAMLLDRGAQEVLALPTSARRLGSRLEAMARVIGTPPVQDRIPPRVTVGLDLEIFPRQRTVQVRRHPMDVTRSEFDLLLALALRPGEVLTRAELVQAVGHRNMTARALESHMSRLRAKLRQRGSADLLVPVRGIGYRLLDR